MYLEQRDKEPVEVEVDSQALKSAVRTYLIATALRLDMPEGADDIRGTASIRVEGEMLETSVHSLLTISNMVTHVILVSDADDLYVIDVVHPSTWDDVSAQQWKLQRHQGEFSWDGNEANDLIGAIEHRFPPSER